MQLLVDLGNSLCKWVLQSDPPIRGAAADPVVLATQWSTLPVPDRIFGCAVGALGWQAEMKQWAHAYWGLSIQWLSVERTALGLYNGYEDLNQLGPDRWAAAQGAYQLFPGKTLIVVSAGTAMVVDIVIKEGQYWGGCVLPGYRLMTESLSFHTARLALVGPGQVVDFPSNTADAVETGCIAALTGVISRMQERLNGQNRSADLLILSGGDALRLRPYIDSTIPSYHVEHLVLEGLAALARPLHHYL